MVVESMEGKSEATREVGGGGDGGGGGGGGGGGWGGGGVWVVFVCLVPHIRVGA